MRILILSDIHGNLDALETVLAHAGTVDATWVLGDVVGYGPQPDACVQRVAGLAPEHWLAGNHDWAALERLDDGDFNTDARTAVRWTRRNLSEDSLRRLGSLEARIDVPGDLYTLVHGSPRYPIWEYILDSGTADDNFASFESRVCLFGHTHVPVIYEEAVDGAARLSVSVGSPMAPGSQRWLINPGSVGQPRDDDPRASYMLLDTETGAFDLRRVTYDVAAVQRRIVTAGLPTSLAARLEYGW
jgi:diadenosine tetraphosphatase ApaH/serine/threonine PP2A family protein phosphatase